MNLWWMLLICTGQGLSATAGIVVRLCFTGNGSEGKSIYIYIYMCQCKALRLLDPEEGSSPVLQNNGKYLPSNTV